MAGMLDKGNLYLIDLAMKQLPSAAPILEIGSFCGLSANVLTHYKRKYGLKNRLITCDKWEFENTAKDSPHIGASPVSFPTTKTSFANPICATFSSSAPTTSPFTVEATSDEFFAAWKEKKELCDILGRSLTLGGPISFCYIDGDHGYEGVKKDFVNCDAFLENGGFLLFDDSTIEDFGVRYLMPEITASGRYRLGGNKSPSPFSEGAGLNGFQILPFPKTKQASA